MVRTRRSIEEENRVHLVSGRRIPSYIEIEEIAENFNSEIYDEIIAWGSAPNKKALVIGLEDHGRIALMLLKKGMFVTAVDKDEPKITALLDEIQKQSLGLRFNHYVKDYMKIEFATTGFDLAVIPFALNRYNEPLVVLRKTKRELKIGGKCFVRFLIKPDIPLSAGKIISGNQSGKNTNNRFLSGAIEKSGKFLSKTLSNPYAEKIRNSLSKLVSERTGFHYLNEEIKKEFRIEKSVVSPPFSSFAADFAHKKGGYLRKFLLHNLKTIIKSEDYFLKKFPLNPFCNSVSFFLNKELELGKTFRVF
jgi:ubiquinone/menaquinone biosynthesis C-methylase UbiE